MSSNSFPTTATVMASPMHGEKAKRITVNFSLRNAPGSSSKPDLVKMTTSAMLRRVADHFLSICRATLIPGTFLRINPTTSIPKRGGKVYLDSFLVKKPPKAARTITLKIPKILPPGKSSCPRIDHNTAQHNNTIKPRVKICPQNPEGGATCVRHCRNMPFLFVTGVS